MVTRQETARRRQALADHLRQITTDGSLLPGDRLPSLRELSATSGLSMPIVARVIKPLVDRGVVRAVRGQGMVIASEQENGRTYAFVLGDEEAAVLSDRPDLRSVRFGFERGVTEFGGAGLATTSTQLARLLAGDRPAVRLDGVFAWTSLPPETREILAERGLPTVTSAYSEADARVPGADVVGFDDFGGGRTATLHLIRHGHRDIAFLGFHRRGDVGAKRVWSRERERGWADALRTAGITAEPRSFCVPGRRRERAAASAARAARELAPHIGDFDAVVAADDVMLLALVGALREAAVDPASWPAMVGFEGLPAARQYACTSLYPDRELLGRRAARLLHDRATGQHSGGPRTDLVEMALVTRISSRRSWAAQVEPLGLIPDVA